MPETPDTAPDARSAETAAFASDRMAAAREILAILKTSRDDEAPVFQAILRHAAELCHAQMAGLNILNAAGDTLTMVAHHGETLRKLEPGRTTWPLAERSIPARAVTESRVLHYPDLKDTTKYRAGDRIRVQSVDEEGIRTFLVVPLLSDGGAVGSMALYRRHVEPFSEDQIALVESYAELAVIAIENVRQFREVQTRLEREAATREILHVISQSRDSETPVFRAILDRAERLCRAQGSGLQLVNEAGTHLLMMDSKGDDHGSFPIGFTFDLSEPLGMCLAVKEQRAVLIEDLKDTDLYRQGHEGRVALVDVEGVRTHLHVPLIKNGVAFGNITLSRKEVSPFSPDEIALVETFAAQAVIAIENVRQFREVQQRLERETATKNILSVISKSNEDDGPVFDAILENACRLCHAPIAGLVLVNDDRKTYRLRAARGAKPEFVAALRDNPPDLDPERFAAARAIVENRVVHVEDLASPDMYGAGDSHRLQTTELEGIRTVLFVPLVLDQMSIGAIGLWRREVKPFSDDEIALVETFAAQAVIAIENVRQFREVQQRLEREQASSEVLSVVSQSRDDTGRVFDALLSRTVTLSQSTNGAIWLVTEDGEWIEAVARAEDGAEQGASFERRRVDDPESVVATCVRECRVHRFEDLMTDAQYTDPEHPNRVWIDQSGARSMLVVPLVSGGRGIGMLGMYRRSVTPYSDDDVALVEGFAAQAVIAIENTRQFRELQNRLARERASSEILGVISENRDDDGPVFEAILRNACALCNAPLAGLILGTAQDAAQRLAAHVGMFPEAIEMFDTGQMRMDAQLSYAARSIIKGELIAFDDMGQSALYQDGSPVVRSMVDSSGIRSVLFVPLMYDGAAIGNITLFRREIDPFDPSEIALVETFAAQAVIAIENVRQFRALEALNAELGDRVEAQVGEIERMGRLKRFLPAAVADTVVSQGSEKMLESHRALIGVLFCDIRGFTAFCETAEPEETIEVLQTYHEEMGKLISDHGAGVDHRMGDGIMVLFNDPLPCDDPAGDALRLGLAMQARMAELCRGWKRLGHKLGFGVGISLGYATVGMVGSEGRYDYTANGTAVNLAARLCDQAEDGEILLSPRAYTAVEDQCRAESHGELKLKGISAPVEVFRVINAG